MGRGIAALIGAIASRGQDVSACAIDDDAAHRDLTALGRRLGLNQRPGHERRPILAIRFHGGTLPPGPISVKGAAVACDPTQA